MKKVLSIILVAVMLVSVFTISAYAEPECDVSDCKYFDKMIELNRGEEPWKYQEIYYHYVDENSEEPDWTFVYCLTDLLMWEIRFGVAVEDILIFSNDTGSISDSCYLVYVTALDKFLRVDSRDIDQILEYCPDFVEIIKERKLCALRGDINDDFEVNIIDATYAQRFLAGYDDSVYARYNLHNENRYTMKIRETGYIVSIDHKDNGNWNYHLLLDYDCDGETTIFDATAIQMKLAKVEDTATE